MIQIKIHGNPIPKARPRARIIKTGSEKDLLGLLGNMRHQLSVKDFSRTGIALGIDNAVEMIKDSKSFVSIYDSQKKETEIVKTQIKEQFNLKPFLTPLMLVVDFNIQRPKSHYGTGKNIAVVKPSAPKFHSVKPDVDNLAKFILDAMNNIVYKDDNQVVEIDACKNYTSDEGSTIVTVHEIKNVSKD